jgi:hypothetical protein
MSQTPASELRISGETSRRLSVGRRLRNVKKQNLISHSDVANKANILIAGNVYERTRQFSAFPFRRDTNTSREAFRNREPEPREHGKPLKGSRES